MSNLGIRIASARASGNASAARHLKRSRWVVRDLHTMRPLPYSVEEGLGSFLPPTALRTSVEFQQGLLDRLNDEVRGTPEETKSVAQTVIDTSPHKEKTLAFNYASLALNNDFYLSHLKPLTPPAENHQSDISVNLGSAIRMQHGSLVQLKSAFSSAALGMSTSGWIWFVSDKYGNTGVLPTFGPGTLLIRSRTYMANVKDLLLGSGLGQLERGDPPRGAEAEAEYKAEMARYSEEPEDAEDDAPRPPTKAPTAPGTVPSSPVSGVSGLKTPPPPGLLPRFFHSSARVAYDLDRMPVSMYDEKDPNAFDRSVPRSKVDMLNIGEVIYPLFCVSVHEHAWMSAGYGVWGKEEWLKKFWTVLDWNKVSHTYDRIGRENTSHKGY